MTIRDFVFYYCRVPSTEIHHTLHIGRDVPSECLPNNTSLPTADLSLAGDPGTALAASGTQRQVDQPATCKQ